MQTSNLDIIVVGIYLCFLILVGVIFSRFSKNSSDYFKAGGRGTWYLVGASMFMSGISTYTFVGNASGIFKAGWSPIVIYLGNIVALGLCAFFLGAWYRQMRVVTFAEIIKERFNVLTEQIVSVLLIMNNLLWAGAVLYGLSVFCAFLLPDVPSWALIIGVGFAVVVYSTIGGNWAVMANDFVQGLVMISITILITTLCFVKAGGVGAFFDAIANSSAAEDLKILTPLEDGAAWSQAKYGLSWALAAFLMQFFNMMSIFAGVRYFSAKDGREAMKASLLGGILMTMGCLLFFVPPIFARIFLYDDVMAMHPDPSRAPEFSYALTSYKILPNGGFSLLIVAMFAAAISSLDTALNRNAAVVVRNITPLIMRLTKRKQLTDDQEVKAGKTITVGLGCLVITIALVYANIKGITLFDLILLIGSLLQLPLFIPLVLILFIRKVPQWAALASIVGGFIPGLIDLIFKTGWSYQEKTIYVLAGGIVVYLLSMLGYKSSSESDKSKWEAFYTRMKTPVDFEKEVGQANDSTQLLQIGKFAVALGSLIGLLAFLGNPLWGRLCILGITGFVAGIGAIMWYAGNRIEKKLRQADN